VFQQRMILCQHGDKGCSSQLAFRTSLLVTLDKLRDTDVDGVTFEGPVDNVDVDSAAVVLFRAALGSGREVLQGHDWCTEV